MPMANEDADLQPATNSQAEHELRMANERWAKALRERDRAALEDLMADDFSFAYPFEGDDKWQFLEDVSAGEVSVGSLSPIDSTVRVFGTAGIVFGSETANWRYRDRDLSGQYRFVRVFAKREGRWQIVSLHLCSSAHR
jgi:ketosteroid isomerase-like protein